MEVLIKWDKNDQKILPWKHIRLAIEAALKQMQCGRNIIWGGDRPYKHYRTRFYDPQTNNMFVFDQHGARQDLLPGSPYLAEIPIPCNVAIHSHSLESGAPEDPQDALSTLY